MPVSWHSWVTLWVAHGDFTLANFSVSRASKLRQSGQPRPLRWQIAPVSVAKAWVVGFLFPSQESEDMASTQSLFRTTFRKTCCWCRLHHLGGCPSQWHPPGWHHEREPAHWTPRPVSNGVTLPSPRWCCRYIKRSLFVGRRGAERGAGLCNSCRGPPFVHFRSGLAMEERI